MGLLDVFRSKGLNPGDGGDDSERTKRNKKVLTISGEDLLDQIISRTRKEIGEVNRLTQVYLHQEKRDRKEGEKQVDFLLDRIAYQTGLRWENDNDKMEIALYLARWATTVIELRNQGEDDKDWKEYQGPLAEFADLDTPMEDLGGDEDFLAMSLRQNPELKKYLKK